MIPLRIYWSISPTSSTILHSPWKHPFSVFSSSTWELLSPKEKILLLRKSDDGEFWYLTWGLGTNALAYIWAPSLKIFTGCHTYARHHVCRDHKDPLNSHGPCDKSSDHWHGAQWTLSAEHGGSHLLLPDFRPVSCHCRSKHSSPRFCLSWPEREMRKEGTTTISHLRALWHHSHPPQSRSPPFMKSHQDALS